MPPRLLLLSLPLAVRLSSYLAEAVTCCPPEDGPGGCPDENGSFDRCWDEGGYCCSDGVWYAKRAEGKGNCEEKGLVGAEACDEIVVPGTPDGEIVEVVTCCPPEDGPGGCPDENGSFDRCWDEGGYCCSDGNWYANQPDGSGNCEDKGLLRAESCDEIVQVESTPNEVIIEQEEIQGCFTGDIIYLPGDSLGHYGVECIDETTYEGVESFCGEDGTVVEEENTFTCYETVPYCVQCGPRGRGAALCLSSPETPDYCETNDADLDEPKVTDFPTPYPTAPREDYAGACAADVECTATVRSREPEASAFGVGLCGCYANSSADPFEECEGQDDGTCKVAKCVNTCEGWEGWCDAGTCALRSEPIALPGGDAATKATAAPVASLAGAPAEVTAAPVATPGDAPATVTEAPVATPGDAPATVTEAPVATGTGAPSASPTDAPPEDDSAATLRGGLQNTVVMATPLAILLVQGLLNN